MMTSSATRDEGGVYGPELQFWDDGEEFIIGVDEAGRGPLAGPVVAAAAAFRPDTVIQQVGDSKQLTAKQRELTFSAIKKYSLAYCIIRKEHHVIDEHNILQATRLAMREAVRDVTRQLNCSNPILLVDGRIPPLESGRHYNVIKGDALSFSIGAASILAKVYRDQIMREYDKQFPDYGFAQHKGYPTAHHRSQLLRYGRCPIHRLSFTIAKHNGDRVSIGDLPKRNPDE